MSCLVFSVFNVCQREGGQYRTSAQTAKLPYWTSHFTQWRLKFLTFINMSTKGAQTEGMVCAGYPLSCERDVKTHNAGSWGRSPIRLTPPPELGREGWPGAPTVFWGRDDHHETSLTNSNSFSSKQVHPSSPFYIKTHHFAPKNFHSSKWLFLNSSQHCSVPRISTAPCGQGCDRYQPLSLNCSFFQCCPH